MNIGPRIIRACNKHFGASLERLYCSDEDFQPGCAPVFILGAPRSGSTLLTQVLADAFRIGYLTNIHCRWFGAPGVAEIFLHPQARKTQSTYTSTYGVTHCQADPAECGEWWYRFFRRDPAYVRSADVEPHKMQEFRRSIVALQTAYRLPLLFKNLYTSLRLEPLVQILPEALFVVIERDWVQNAQSILSGRKESAGRYDKWWSVPPPDVDSLAKMPAVEQVIGQIESIYRLIDSDIGRLGYEHRTIRISYETFCNDVHGTLNRFECFMAQHGTQLEHRFSVPERFEVSRAVKIPPEMYAHLIRSVKGHQSRFPSGA